jgi:hypothetical protein
LLPAARLADNTPHLELNADLRASITVGGIDHYDFIGPARQAAQLCEQMRQFLFVVIASNHHTEFKHY